MQRTDFIKEGNKSEENSEGNFYQIYNINNNNDEENKSFYHSQSGNNSSDKSKNNSNNQGQQENNPNSKLNYINFKNIFYL